MKQNIAGPVFERNEEFIDALVGLFTNGEISRRPQAIIETGTYLGTGTTAQVIEAVERASENKQSYRPKMFSIEVNENNYKVAKKLNKSHPWITFIHGSSVDLGDAKFFVKHDEMLINHENYPDIYFDAEDPVTFYLAEIEGLLDFYGTGRFGKNNVLAELVPKYQKKKPLFILDSAGGVGYFEFMSVVEDMGNERYYVALLGINHVKHYRSYQQILSGERWVVNAESESWVVATRQGRSGHKVD